MAKDNKAQAQDKTGSLADRLSELRDDKPESGGDAKSGTGAPPPLPRPTPAAKSARKSATPRPDESRKAETGKAAPPPPIPAPPQNQANPRPQSQAGRAAPKPKAPQERTGPKPRPSPERAGAKPQPRPERAGANLQPPPEHANTNPRPQPTPDRPKAGPKPVAASTQPQPSQPPGPKRDARPPAPGPSAPLEAKRPPQPNRAPQPNRPPPKTSGLDADNSEVPAAIRPPVKPEEAPAHPSSQQRRAAERRPAGPSRERIAANDDAPSIGGLIYALNQRPSNKPFAYAAAGSGLWAAFAVGFAGAIMAKDISLSDGLVGIVLHPIFLAAVASLVGPIVLFWFLAYLMWRTEELHLRSSAMTEVAVRLAEPDRMAEQSVASLGQAVRRQVSFMNDAVSRALGRAGELEVLVHNEVSALEQSYEENERKIRGLIHELAGERHALLNTGDRFRETLVQLGAEVPQLIEKLGSQQLKLAKIIEGAGTNLSQLEAAIGSQSHRLESALDGSANRFQNVLEEYTVALAGALGSRSEQMENMLGGYTNALGGALGSRIDQMQTLLVDNRSKIDASLSGINSTLSEKTETMQNVFEEYARALDKTLSNRAETFDTQLVERTKALDEAFTERLRLFDETVMRSTMSIDSAVGESAKALTSAMESHAENLSRTLSEQASELDESLLRGIESVRSTSENISRQSIKAIEGLANQSDVLRNVSENLLEQIHNVSSRFESQGQSIMRSANALETANYRIDKMLEDRSVELNTTLDRMSEKAEELGQAVSGYSSTIEGSVSDAEQRARLLTQDLAREAARHARATVDDLERMKSEARLEAERALDDLKSEFSSVSREVTDRLGSLSTEFSKTTGEVREQAARAAQQLEDEQDRLRQQLDRLPSVTEESAHAMRRALQDQLKALDNLSSLANRTAEQAAISPPPAAAPPAGQQPIPLQQIPDESGRRADLPPEPLSSLTDTLARELNERKAREAESAGAAAAAKSSPPAKRGDARGGRTAKWSFGDLLARASDDDNEPLPAEENVAAPMANTAEPPPAGEEEVHPAAQQSTSSEGGLDLAAIAGALDRSMAAAIWSRFRSGQRGFMVRSIYAPEARNLFDDVVYKYQNQPHFRDHVDRFLLEFEQGLRECDQRDPSGELTQDQIVTDTGRVYLLLAHASQRLV